MLAKCGCSAVLPMQLPWKLLTTMPMLSSLKVWLTPTSTDSLMALLLYGWRPPGTAAAVAGTLVLGLLAAARLIEAAKLKGGAWDCATAAVL